MFILNALLAVGLALQSTPVVAGAKVEQVPLPPPASQVLAIPDEMREAFREKVLVTRSPEQRLYRLVDFMFKPDGLGLKYTPDVTSTVAESYRTRRVNCMAFTMMAVALAREAGFVAYAQQIDRVMAWDLTGDVVTQSLHANAVVVLNGRKFMLDIAAGRLSAPVMDYRISDEHLLALFYGNRAMEALAGGHVAEALTWQQEALRQDQGDATLWNNAGVLRQRLGDPAAAESMYLEALKRDSSLTSALSNLVAFYQRQGHLRKAHYWQQYAERALRRDPYYQFTQGRRDEAAGDYRGAIGYYKRAISLYKREHLFHFYLARAYYEMGSLKNADQELGLAAVLSEGTDQQRYQAKQDALRIIMN